MRYDLLRALMREKKITNKMLADECGLSVRAVDNWFYRESDIDVITAYKIACILGTSVEYLVTGQGPQPGIPKDLQQVIDKYASHTETQDVPDYTILCADNPPDKL